MAKIQKSKTKVVPLGDRVLVRPLIDKSEKTKSGIYIPETVSKEQSGEGEVIAVGEGHYENGKLIPLSISVGDTILFSKYSYEDVKIDGEQYYILKSDNILAVIK